MFDINMPDIDMMTTPEISQNEEVINTRHKTFGLEIVIDKIHMK